MFFDDNGCRVLRAATIVPEGVALGEHAPYWIFIEIIFLLIKI